MSCSRRGRSSFTFDAVRTGLSGASAAAVGAEARKGGVAPALRPCREAVAGCSFILIEFLNGSRACSALLHSAALQPSWRRRGYDVPTCAAHDSLSLALAFTCLG